MVDIEGDGRDVGLAQCFLIALIDGNRLLGLLAPGFLIFLGLLDLGEPHVAGLHALADCGLIAFDLLAAVGLTHWRRVSSVASIR